MNALTTCIILVISLLLTISRKLSSKGFSWYFVFSSTFQELEVDILAYSNYFIFTFGKSYFVLTLSRKDIEKCFHTTSFL